MTESDGSKQDSETYDRLPRFDLDYLVDDIDEPTKVMIVPNWDRGGGLDRWITMDTEHVVSLDEVP